METWKDIKWYEWYYQISSLWRVKSLDKYVKTNIKNVWKRLLKWKILKRLEHKWWYWYCDLSVNWKVKRLRLNRRVAEAFKWFDINRKDLVVCHYDDNPRNDRIDNLFIGTQKDNIQDCIKKWRRYINRSMLWKFWELHPRSKKVCQFNINWTFKQTWNSIADAVRELKLSQWNISACLIWKRKTTWGFIWKYN